MKKSKFILIVFALALVINIQTFPLFLIFSINSSKISLHNNCIGVEPAITNPELKITEVKYNYKKHIISETNSETNKANFNVINIDNLNVIQENYPDKFNIPLLIIKGEIKYKINSGEEEVLKLYINQFEYEIKGESKYGRLSWKKDEKNDDLINFTFYNNGLNKNLKPLIPLKSKDMKPEETAIKIKCKDQKENESEESTVNVYYSPIIWLKLTVGNTKVEEVKPDKQVKIQGENNKEPDWEPYQVYDESTKKLKEYNLDTEPIVENGTTLVPIRFISEAFGAEVKYDDQIKKIQINFKDKGISIYLYVGKTDCYILDQKLKTQTKKSLNTPPVIKNGRALVPLRFIGEEFGAEVNWISQTKEIQIIYSALN